MSLLSVYTALFIGQLKYKSRLSIPKLTGVHCNKTIFKQIIIIVSKILIFFRRKSGSSCARKFPEFYRGNQGRSILEISSSHNRFILISTVGSFRFKLFLPLSKLSSTLDWIRLQFGISIFTV